MQSLIHATENCSCCIWDKKLNTLKDKYCSYCGECFLLPGSLISIILIKKLLLKWLSKSFLIRIILIGGPGAKTFACFTKLQNPLKKFLALFSSEFPISKSKITRKTEESDASYSLWLMCNNSTALGLLHTILANQ